MTVADIFAQLPVLRLTLAIVDLKLRHSTPALHATSIATPLSGTGSI